MKPYCLAYRNELKEIIQKMSFFTYFVKPLYIDICLWARLELNQTRCINSFTFHFYAFNIVYNVTLWLVVLNDCRYKFFCCLPSFELGIQLEIKLSINEKLMTLPRKSFAMKNKNRRFINSLFLKKLETYNYFFAFGKYNCINFI